MPTKSDIESIDSPHVSSIIAKLPPVEKPDLSAFIPNAPDDAVDLMQKLMTVNPNKRLNVQEALEHPYLKQFHNDSSEPTCERRIEIPIDDNKKFSIREYRQKIYDDIQQK